MISRRSAKLIADAYKEVYIYLSTNRYGNREVTYYRDNLYDFLYLNNFDGWFMNKMKKLSGSDARALPEFVMRLHTGESITDATPEWTWPQRAALGKRLLHNLAEAIICTRHSDPQFEGYGKRKGAAVDEMQRALELDGYIYRDGTLYVPEESVVDDQEEQGVLGNLLNRAALNDAKTINHHLDLSVEHYQAQRWDDSISNSRKVLEAILQQIALKHSHEIRKMPLTASELEKPVVVRDYLEASGLLDRKEKEAIAKCYALLSDTGGHPHIAERDQARLMRHLALTFSQFALLRFLSL